MISFTMHGRRNRHSLLMLSDKLRKRFSGLLRNRRPGLGRRQVVVGDDKRKKELGGVLTGKPLEVFCWDRRVMSMR